MAFFFTGTVEVPPGFAEGEWHWVQLVKDELNRKKDDNTCEKAGGTWLLDSEYPYDPPPYDPDPEYPGSYSTGSTPESTGDSPISVLSAGLIEKRGHIHYKMYIMFKPSGESSQWVPLRRIKWEWSFCVSKASGTWAIVNSGKKASQSEEISDHPKWTDYWKEFIMWEGPVQCPPPCEPQKKE